MNVSLCISFMTKGIALAVILQSIELLQIKSAFASDGIWDWAILNQDFPRSFSRALDIPLSYRGFIGILILRILAGISLLAYPSALAAAYLLVSTFLICFRFRGTFNGGSDYMTFIVLLALVLIFSLGEHPFFLTGILWYVSIQVCLSFFLSGVAKVKTDAWRSGRALSEFMRSRFYDIPPSFHDFPRNSPLSRIACWGVILFELSFPLALVIPSLTAGYLSLAVIFHILNIYIFGLNRFLFAWIAAYPAIMYCSSR
jgi:hypothetical protein